MMKALLALPVLLLLALPPFEALAGDVFLSRIGVYANLPAGTPEAKEHGPYPEVRAYDPHDGLAPSRVDVVVIVNGSVDETVQVVLEVFPIVGVTNWASTEGVTDVDLLHASKVRLPAVIRQQRSVILGGRKRVTFAQLDLFSVIDRYSALGLWPAELAFRATAHPVAGETALRNNVMERGFPLKPHD